MSEKKILIGTAPDFKMTQGRLDLFHTVIIKVYFDHKLHRSDRVYDKSLRQMAVTLKEKISAFNWALDRKVIWSEENQLIAEITSSQWNMSLRYHLFESLDRFQRANIHQAMQENFL